MSEVDEPTWAAPAARFAGIDDVTVAYAQHPYPLAAFTPPSETEQPMVARRTLVVTQRAPPAKASFSAPLVPTVGVGLCLAGVITTGLAMAAYAGVIPMFPAACFAVGLVCIDVACVALMVALSVR